MRHIRLHQFHVLLDAELYDYQLSFMIVDAQQMDCFLALKYSDIQLWIKSPSHKSRLLGPAGVDVDLNTALYRSHPPMTSCVVSSPIMYIKLGNKCFKLLTDTINDLTRHIPKKVTLLVFN